VSAAASAPLTLASYMQLLGVRVPAKSKSKSKSK
jgi:hypothetical protein